MLLQSARRPATSGFASISAYAGPGNSFPRPVRTVPERKPDVSHNWIIDPAESADMSRRARARNVPVLNGPWRRLGAASPA